MGSCSSNQDNNGGEGFNPGNDQNGNQGFNPGNNSHRPHSRQAGNMAPNAEQPQNEEAAAGANPNADSAVPHGNLMSPQLGGQAAAPQLNAAGAPPAGLDQESEWRDKQDPQTGNGLLPKGHVGYQEMPGNQIPLNNMEANRQAWEAATRLGGQANEVPQPVEQFSPPMAGQAGQGFGGNHMYIGAASGDIANGKVVMDGHWEEFEAANNVMSMEEYEAEINRQDFGHQL